MKEKAYSPYVKKIIALLFAGWCVIWIYRTMMGAVQGEIMAVVGPQSAARMGLIASCYFAGYVCMQIPGGFLIDRFGMRRILAPSFLLLALGFAVVGLSKRIETLYIGSAIAGVGSGTYYSGAFSLSSRNVPKGFKYFATAVINSGCAFGMLFGYLYASGLVKQLGMDWRVMPFILAVLAATMTPMMLALLKGERESAAQEDGPTKKRAALAPLARMLLSPRMLASYFFYFSTCYGYYMIVSWLPVFLQNERGFSGALAGYASAVIALVSIPGALFLGRVVDRFSHKKVAFLTSVQILSGVMLLCVTAFDQRALIILSLALYGITGKQAVDPLIVPHVTEQFDDSALSTGLGVFNFFGMSASVAAPFVTGLLQDARGSQVFGFYIAAALIAVSSVVFRLVNARPQR